MSVVTGPNGRQFTILPDGRKIDEDGFVCAMGTPGQKEGAWFCVAVKITDDAVMIRDTKDPTKNTLSYTREEWGAFLDGVMKGEFNL